MEIPILIKDQINLLPKTPGVYFFKSKSGEILYVGKATSLRDRVRSYWAKELGRGPAIQRMVTMIHTIDYEQYESTVEAMIAEANYIKRFLPKYNVQFRDDKSYFYVKLDTTDGTGFARLSMVHKNQILSDEKHIRYFGPYTSGKHLRLALKTIRKIFPYRSCTVMPKKACLQYHIKRCQAPCIGEIDKKEYAAAIRKVVLILEGKKERLVLQLKKEMEYLAKKQQFEQATKIRNQYLALQHLQQMAKISDMDPELARNQVQQIVDKNIPARIEGFDVSNTSGKEASVSMVVFVHGKPAKYLYKRFTIRGVTGPNDYAMLQEALGRRIKRAQVHNGAEEMINQSTWEITDDESWQLPDLFIIDGGRGQVSAVEQVVEQFGLSVPIMGIAKGRARKGEDLFFSGKTAFRDIGVIRAIRDEAHRFALAHHKILRSKQLLHSDLDAIAGVGVSTRQKLLRQFGSVQGVRAASFDNLQKIVGTKNAKSIHAHFKI